MTVYGMIMAVGDYPETVVHIYQITKAHNPEDISFQHSDKVSG
jgi:hypothetical protein